MKAILFIALIACAFSTQVLDAQDPALFELFQSWKTQYNMNFDTIEEEAHRFETFVQNYYFVQEYNSQGNTATLALNQFAHLNTEEFGAMIKGLNANSGFTLQNNFPTVELSADDIPSEVDWVTKGAVTNIKNQQQCGGCWAFAAASVMESFNFLQGHSLVSLSPQQLIDCVKTCDGCNGCDNLYNALIYTAASGIEALSDYPITDENGPCKYNSGDVVSKNTGHTNVQPKSVSQLQAAIAQQPTIVGIEASQNVFQLYHSGVISANCGDQVDHAVTAVGYGTQEGSGAFMIKNSWGASWGMNGYVYISDNGSANGGMGVCGILTMPVYPTTI